MNRVVRLSLCLCVMIATSMAEEVKKNSSETTDDLVFDTLDVSATQIKKEDKTFLTPGAVSSREGLSDSTQSIDSIVRSMPGSYTNTDQSQGTVQVNIRGTTGFGRVNTMIDGVTQTFFGTSADNGKFHLTGNGLSTSVFGAPADKNFLVSVDIEKGSFSGGHGGLMGSANFRTIGVDDIIQENRNVGFLGRYSYGSNGLGPSYMGSVAAKTEFENGDSLGIIFGYSGKKITQDYRIGGGTKISEQEFEDSYGDNDVSPFDPKDLTQRPKGYLFKIESAFHEDNKAILSYRRYENVLAGRDMANDTYQLDYRYNPISDFVDTKFLLAYNTGKQQYNSDASLFSNTQMTEDGNLQAKNNALTLDISNALQFAITDQIALKMRPGFNYLDNEYKNNNQQKENANYDIEAIPFQPKGAQKITSFYLDNTLQYDIYELNANMNLSHWELEGYKPECYKNPSCFPKAAMNIKSSDTNMNISLMLSAKIDDYFTPFISYAKTTRPPNIQEMFFTDNFGDSINPFLKPEKAQTYQIGFNSFKHGLITNDDRFGFKIVYYRTNVDDFIYNKSFHDDKANRWTLHLNALEKAKFKGIETELHYDMGLFFTKLSYSHEESEQPVNETYGNDMFGFGKIAVLPEDYANLDIGMRFFSEKLVLGWLAKYTGKSKRVNPSSKDEGRDIKDDDYLSERATQDLPNIPMVHDFYSSYKPTKNLTFKLEIENIFDENYIDALNAFNSNEPELYDENGAGLYLFKNSARGRTFKLSFEYRY